MSFQTLLSNLLLTIDNVSSLADDSFSEFAILVRRIAPILKDLEAAAPTPSSVRKAVESLDGELRRCQNLFGNSNSCASVRQIEDATHDLGRCLGLVLMAGRELSVEIKEKLSALQKEMIAAKFDSDASIDSDDDGDDDNSNGHDAEVELIGNVGERREEDDRISLDTDDVALHLKNGNDDQFSAALSELRDITTAGLVGNEWFADKGIISILLNRLNSSKHDCRLAVILMLRSLASMNDENKEKMEDVRALSIIARSLTRDVDERREAVGLLLSLSDIPRIRQRMGKVQGCIVMLVAMLNGEDQCASRDAGKLLSALSGNTQNVLHMAEAGYFKPLVQYLKKGTDMNKILLATALGRMELTDQSRASLGGEGSIQALVKMFNSGKLEAKLSALGALQNLSMLAENVHRLINSGIVAPLLQLLFSVTSVLMTLREPASAILASIAQSEMILINQDVALQMLSLLNLSNPVIQYHLLRALNSIVSHSSAATVRVKMKETGAVQLLLPFLSVSDTEIRTTALSLLFNLSKDFAGELTEQLGETHLNIIANIILVSTTENEKAAALGVLSNLPVNDKKATEILKKAHLLPILISLMGLNNTTLTPSRSFLLETIAAVLIRFTVPSDKKLQRASAELGVIPLLVKLLSIGSPVTKSRAATSLTQLSQNSLTLSKAKASRWTCVPSSSEACCGVHDGYCFVKSTFCLVKAGAISPLVHLLEGKDREADEAVLNALATLMQDEIWENGCQAIAKASGVQGILRVLEVGSVKAQEKAVWMLERIFRIEAYRQEYGEPAQVLLIDLAQKGAPSLKSTIAKILAHLQILQMQSSYF